MVSINDLKFSNTEYKGHGGSESIRGVSQRRFQNREILFKKYQQDSLQNIDTQALNDLINWRKNLSEEDRSYIDRHAALPLDAVTNENSHIMGFLMSEAPSLYFFENKKRPRDINELGRSAAKLKGNRFSHYPPPYKVALLGKVLEILIWLHEHGIVIGDLQPRNILIGPVSAEKNVYLVDCDAFLLNQKSAITGLEPETWITKDNSDRHSQETDRAKFALLLFRCLTEDFGQYLPLEENKPADFSAMNQFLPQHWVNILQAMWDLKPLDSRTLKNMARRMQKFVASSQDAQQIRTFIWPSFCDTEQPWPLDAKVAQGILASSPHKLPVITQSEPARPQSPKPPPPVIQQSQSTMLQTKSKVAPTQGENSPIQSVNSPQQQKIISATRSMGTPAVAIPSAQSLIPNEDVKNKKKYLIPLGIAAIVLAVFLVLLLIKH